LAAGLYAKKSYGIPTIASVVSIGLHLLVNSILVFGLKWGAVSIAVSTSVAAFVNAAILVTWMQRRFNIWVFEGSLLLTVKIFFASAIGALGAWSFGTLQEEFSRVFLTQIARILGMTGMFAIGFLLTAYILKIKNPDRLQSGF
jgi:peptidoglycan biosynthesis protein MviN/MurJ (putative lipid II flippase)